MEHLLICCSIFRFTKTYSGFCSAAVSTSTDGVHMESAASGTFNAVGAVLTSTRPTICSIASLNPLLIGSSWCGPSMLVRSISSGIGSTLGGALYVTVGSCSSSAHHLFPGCQSLEHSLITMSRQFPSPEHMDFQFRETLED